jgi:hypothetical protein
MPMKILIVVVMMAIPLIPTFWAILDIPKRRFNSAKQKLIWFFTVSTLPCIGAVLYILVGRRQTIPLETCPAGPVNNQVSQH